MATSQITDAKKEDKKKKMNVIKKHDPPNQWRMAMKTALRWQWDGHHPASQRHPTCRPLFLLLLTFHLGFLYIFNYVAEANTLNYLVATQKNETYEYMTQSDVDESHVRLVRSLCFFVF